MAVSFNCEYMGHEILDADEESKLDKNDPFNSIQIAKKKKKEDDKSQEQNQTFKKRKRAEVLIYIHKLKNKNQKMVAKKGDIYIKH